MSALSEKFALQPDQFAILFETDLGIEADDLGTFLKRAATLARREGVELRVVRFEPGSLATIFRAFKKSKIIKNAKAEFNKKPIASTGVMTAVVGAVASAFIWAFDTEQAGVTPLSRAGACVVEEKEVTQIKLITMQQTVVLMDKKKAHKVREIERKHDHLPELQHEPMKILAHKASEGSLEGDVVSVSGELHFRPDGYRFLVPINVGLMDQESEIFPDAHFRVTGEILMRRGRPDSIVIRSAKQV